MYVELKHVDILIALLKKYGVKHLVLSPGSRNVPFVHSVEMDEYFKCYSIVDERSAGFFAIGLIQELREPVAICCTSGTAVCNYFSAVSEAYYQCLPLVVLTANRNVYYLNQMEDQMIPQSNMFKNVCKCEVVLPYIRSAEDEWYCQRLINEALGNMTHHGLGPVHIDFQVPDGHFEYSIRELPEVRKIERTYIYQEDRLKKKFEELIHKKVLVVYGQSAPHSIEETKKIREFVLKYGVALTVDQLSNLHFDECIWPFVLTKTMNRDIKNKLKPDIVISLNGNHISGMRGVIRGFDKSVDHWLVSETGDLADPFRKLTDIFEMTAIQFVDLALKYAPDNAQDHSFSKLWKENTENINFPEVEYCDWYIVKRFVESMPDKVLLHLANSSSVRIAQYFRLPKGTRVYCNRGTNGIDGSMSSFIAQSYITQDLSFLLIGDLSFFYDMNALWNRYVGSNVRILLNNNEGAEMFHYTHGVQRIGSLNKHIAAEHRTSAKGWAEERGFKYLRVTNKIELENALKEFMKVSERPILLEAFTDKKTDADFLIKLEKANTQIDGMELMRRIKRSIKKT